MRVLARSITCIRQGTSAMRTHAAELRRIGDTLHPHSARHLCAVAAESHGIPVRQITRDLGRSCLAITEASLERGCSLARTVARTLAELLTAGQHAPAA